MCGDCWNAAMGAPAALVAGRFAWVGYKDRIPFLGGRGRRATDSGRGDPGFEPPRPGETVEVDIEAVAAPEREPVLGREPLLDREPLRERERDRELVLPSPR
ncbi:hypothetical protein [Iamia sp.]|uniref:hypothetical protein n=1 Tax=Iamia sp. TaxID=2722710 RepID=UPI002B8DBFB5|nr:hypothetical protein [Iamia sp.]HXH55709.1 hypothetical protein [Iamia sp.]